MMADIWRNVRLTLVTFALLGVLYSLAVLGVGQALFPWQANGSLLSMGGRTIGSALIGQAVTSKDLFQDRPSATTNPRTGRPEPYAANNSGGSNLGPTNAALVSSVRQSLGVIRRLVGGATIPASLVESSGSGLDPEITVQAALVQVAGLSQRTGIPEAELRTLVLRHAKGPTFGIYGPSRVNVLELNIALQGLESQKR